MEITFDILLTQTLVIVITLGIGILAYFKRSYKYWEKRQCPYLTPTFPLGNAENPLKRKDFVGGTIRTFYQALKSQGHKHGGVFLFSKPRYMPVHPEYIKNVMQNDFSHFTERGLYYNEVHDPLSANMFFVGGQKWRNLRTKLTPTFTSGKMKMMFETTVQCGHQMQEAVQRFCENQQALDIKDVSACYATDVIGSCAFGLECNSFKRPDAEFRKYGRKIFEPVTVPKFAQLAFAFGWPELARKVGIKVFPSDATEFFMNVVKDTVKFRETSNFLRNDMLQILINLKNDLVNGNVKAKAKLATGGLTIEELAAQAFVFFFAGFETSSTAMTFCLFELARNPDIQERLREEINEELAKQDGKMTYEGIMSMKYMTQVVDETLRMYPPVSFITRRCVKDYQVPETQVVIEEGIEVFISVLGLHYDPEYYPDPQTFDPERFTDKNRSQRPPFTYIPFGEGPRICIGLRFGTMQTKIGLALLLRNFRFSLNKKTVVPLQMNPYSFVLTTRSEIFLDVERIRH